MNINLNTPLNEDDRLKRNVITNFSRTVPMGSEPEDTEYFVETIFKIHSKNGLEGKEVMELKNIKTSGGIPFVLAREQQTMLKMLMDSKNGELDLNKDFFDLMEHYVDGKGCLDINYFTKMSIDLYVFIEDILQSGISLSDFQKVSLEKMKMKVSLSLFQIENYLKYNELQSDGFDNLLDVISSIKNFINILSETDKDKINSTKIEKFIEIIQPIIIDHKVNFPLLLIPPEVKFSPRNLIMSFIDIATFARSHVSVLPTHINASYSDFSKEKPAKKLLKRVKTITEETLVHIKNIEDAYNKIINLCKEKGCGYTFNPQCTNFQESLTELNGRIQKIDKIKGDVRVEWLKVQSLYKDIMKLSSNNSNLDIKTNLLHHIVVPYVMMNRMIDWGTLRISQVYSPKNIQHVNSLIENIPKSLLSNRPSHSQKICDALIFYAHSLCIEIDNGKGLNGKFYRDIHGILDLLADISILISNYHDKSNLSASFVKGWRKVSFDGSIKLLGDYSKEFLLEAFKDRSKPDEKKMMLSQNCVKLIKIIQMLAVYATDYSLSFNENPLVQLSKKIPGTHLQEDKLPPFVLLAAHQIVPTINMIVYEIERDEIYLKSVIDKFDDEKKKLLLEGKKIMGFLKSISLKTLKLLPQKIESLSDLYRAYIILHKYYKSFHIIPESCTFIETLNKEESDSIVEEIFAKNTSYKGYKTLTSIGMVLYNWISEFDLLRDKTPKKIQNKQLGSLLELDKEIDDKIDETLHPTNSMITENLSSSITIEKETPLIIRKSKCSSVQNRLSNLIIDSKITEEDSLILKNMFSYLANLQIFGELENSPWPESIQYPIAFQYCLNSMLLIEQLLKLGLSESVTRKKTLEGRNERGQMLKSSHHLVNLLEAFSREHPQVIKKISAFRSFVRSLRVENIIDRHDSLEEEGLLGQHLSNLKDLIAIDKSIQENTLDEFAIDYCTQQLGKDRSKWREKIDKKREDSLRQLRKIGERLLGFVDDILPLLIPHSSSDNKSMFLVPKEKSLNAKKSLPLELLVGIKSQYSILEEQLLSEDISQESQQTCLQILKSLKDLNETDLSKNLRFAPTLTSMRLNKFERFLEEFFKAVIDRFDPEYLQQDHETGGQSRPLSHSHRLDIYLEKLETLLPKLVVSKEVKSEFKLLTSLMTTLHHYPASKIENGLNLNLQILNDQSRIQIELSSENLSKESTQWLIERYGQDMDNWNKLQHDQAYLFYELMGVGLPSLKLVSDILQLLKK